MRILKSVPLQLRSFWRLAFPSEWFRRTVQEPMLTFHPTAVSEQGEQPRLMQGGGLMSMRARQERLGSNMTIISDRILVLTNTATPALDIVETESLRTTPKSMCRRSLKD